MLEVEGKVIKIEAGFAWITREGTQTCGNCDPKIGCKSMAISRLFCKKEQAFRVRDPFDVSVGERVSIGIEEKALLQGAVAGYGVPILAMIVGAAIGRYMGEEYLSVMGSVMGFLATLLWLSKKKMTPGNIPIIVQRVLEAPAVMIHIHNYVKKEACDNEI